MHLDGLVGILWCGIGILVDFGEGMGEGFLLALVIDEVEQFLKEVLLNLLPSPWRRPAVARGKILVVKRC